MTTTVFCTVSSEAQANDVVARLQSSGVPADAISLLLPERAVKRLPARDKNPKAVERVIAPSVPGGIVGGTLSLLPGVSMFAIPGAGTFIIAGPVLESLTTVAPGAEMRGITGALIELGFSESDAKRLEAKLRDGAILVAARSESGPQTRVVSDVFEHSGAANIDRTSPRPARSAVDAVGVAGTS